MKRCGVLGQVEACDQIEDLELGQQFVPVPWRQGVKDRGQGVTVAGAAG